MQLPSEILLEIFERLDRKTLKSCLLVSKQWNSLITQTASTMKELPLTLKDSHIERGDVVQLTRKYKCITLRELHAWNDQMMEELGGVGESVEKLILRDCVFFGNDFAYLIACFPNLQELSINWCNFGLSKKPIIVLVQLKRLKKISIEGEAYMLKHILCEGLENLTLIRVYQEDQPAVISFLNQQTSLKALKLEHISDLFSSSREQINVNFTFKLEYLSLNVLPFAHSNHMMALLYCARNCAHISVGVEIPSWIPLYVIKNFDTLRSLEIHSELLPLLESFYVGLKPNTRLSKLRVDGYLEDDTEEMLLAFLKHFPNVISLDLIDLAGCKSAHFNMWEKISQTMPKITHLRMPRMNVFNMMCIKLPFLKSLEIEHLGYVECELWVHFGRNNPAIESLEIDTISCLPEFGVDCIMRSLSKLNYLSYQTLEQSSHIVLCNKKSGG